MSAAVNVPRPETTNPTTPIVNPAGSAPPLASAPFDANQAKQHQAAWAKHLGSPVTFDNSIGMMLVCIPAGEFDRGSPDTEQDAQSNEKPQHRVRITRLFYLGRYEVTQGEYEQVMQKNPSYFSPSGDGRGRVTGRDTRQFPVENVSWYDAEEFCRKLSELPLEKTASRTYRLPMEAEWEYACRAGTTTPFHFGGVNNGREANIDGKGPYGTTIKGPYLQHTTEVGSYPANAFGLCDLHGNVWEWCLDGYDAASYQPFRSRMAVDPTEPSTGSSVRVLRGGSCNFSGVNARAANRLRNSPASRNYDVGFRVVCAFGMRTP
ncbi:MAG: formylglycine-generating enzyme family protein [Planctomycetales bacterium]|nr:formylglycine-generating enzyme family protein [Planctomycetales bacterium]